MKLKLAGLLCAALLTTGQASAQAPRLPPTPTTMAKAVDNLVWAQATDLMTEGRFLDPATLAALTGARVRKADLTDQAVSLGPGWTVTHRYALEWSRRFRIHLDLPLPTGTVIEHLHTDGSRQIMLFLTAWADVEPKGYRIVTTVSCCDFSYQTRRCDSVGVSRQITSGDGGLSFTTMVSDRVTGWVAGFDTAPVEVQSDHWRVKVTDATGLLDSFPERGIRMETGGVVDLQCQTATPPSRETCTVVTQAPRIVDFSDAALRALRFVAFGAPAGEGAGPATAPVRVSFGEAPRGRCLG